MPIERELEASCSERTSCGRRPRVFWSAATCLTCRRIPKSFRSCPFCELCSHLVDLRGGAIHAMHDLTISIGNIGNFEQLETCLQSIYGTDREEISFEVWVVYNGVQDDGVTDRIQATFPRVVLLKRRGPLGYCAVHNLVMSQCKSRYVLVLDDDTIVAPGTLSKMVRFMDANPDVGMAGCKTLNRDGTLQKTYGLLPTLQTELSNAFMGAGFWPDRLYQNTSVVKDVEWLNGSFMFARSSALEQAGLLDERYYTYVCESDWCYRITQAGWRVVFVPDATIVHIGGEHSLQTTRKPYVNIVRYHVNRYYYFRKHLGRARMLLLRPIMTLGAANRMMYFWLVWLASPSRREEARTRIKAFWTVMGLALSARPDEMPAGVDNRRRAR